MTIIRLILFITLCYTIYYQQTLLIEAYDYNDLLYDNFVDLWKMCE